MEPETDQNSHLAELALQQSDHVSAMLGYWDTNLLCRFANKAYVDWFGVTKEELIGKIHLSELLGPLYAKNLPHITDVLTGKPQMFEREIPIPGSNLVKHSLATYYPDIKNGEILGFFVHVADVTSIKDLEKKLANAKRETLRKIIETEENEKRSLVDILRENVNQRLVACKIILEGEEMKGSAGAPHRKVCSLMSEIIGDINQLCEDLTPTEIEMLGLIDSARHYLSKLPAEQRKKINFVCEDLSLEQYALKDKFSIFRILQNLITIALESAGQDTIMLTITHKHPCITIELKTNGKITLDKTSKEYNAIACRADYYGGKIIEQASEFQTILQVEFDC